MPMTIPDYAKDRHISRQAVDKVLKKRPDIDAKTYMGISHGRDTKFLSDEAVGMLDQTIKMPYSNVEEVSKELVAMHNAEMVGALQHTNEVLEAQNLIRDKLEGVQERLTDEVAETRRQLLERTDASHKELLKKMEEVSGDYITKDDIQELSGKLSEAQATISKLLEMLEQAENDKKALKEEIEKYRGEAERQKEEAGKYHKSVFGLYKKES